MKKVLSFLVAITMLLGVFATTASALDVAPKFTEHFFPEGKAGAPTEIYYQIKTNDNGQANCIYMWLTQPDDVMALFGEMETVNDYTAFCETYGMTSLDSKIQLDCKVDDGEWHYMPEWDKNEYPQEDQPYDLALRQYIRPHEDSQSYCEGSPIMDAWYTSDEGAGYLAPIVVSNDGDPYFDLENHSITLRARYLFEYQNNALSDEDYEANGDSCASFICSDWSEEITLGKDATQVEPVKPESIEPIVLSDLTFESAEYGEEGYAYSTWKVFADFPKQVGDAQRYYVVKEDGFEPLNAVIEYRVQKDGVWGEWNYSYWGNSTWLTSGWKWFGAEGVDKNDIIEFHAYIENNMEEGKDSPYSNSLFCGVEDVKPVNGDTTGDGFVNMKDVLQLRKYVAGIVKEINENLADCNRDKSINMKDVLLLRKYLAGLAELPEIYEDIETDVTEVPWNE